MMFRGDAEFVDIIHTNSGNLWEGCLSFAKNLGHVDFYPAGGSHQANVFFLFIYQKKNVLYVLASLGSILESD